MKNNNLITPEGTNDLLFKECVMRRSVEKAVSEVFFERGYSEIITPGLEFLDVFNLNSRHFPQEDLYKLVDRKGRLIVLRPESTMPIARVVATRLKEATLPLRLCYNQCAFNVSTQMRGRSDQIVQAGIELIGSSDRITDFEVIETAAAVLEKCSTGNYSLEIGDIGFFKELMNQLSASDEEKETIRNFIETKNYPALNDILDSIGDNNVTKALKMLPRLFGGEEVFEKASKLFSDEKTEAVLSGLRELFKDIEKLGLNGKITVDLGMVNKTDYYTGVILKGYIEGYGEPVISGGRYDRLISEFGYDVPATGFAVNVDAVTKVRLKSEKVTVREVEAIVFAEKGFEMKAVLHARELRKEGKKVELAAFNDIEKVKKYAAEVKISKIISVSDTIKEI
ncbi:MAG: ATP phosphoribosyltransferase regulatory subunit [Oscillospiraceae bacterium]|nr:ATP phosphoribosyltransferase regulatory subunit [Oscillospiraceae bacterium]